MDNNEDEKEKNDENDFDKVYEAVLNHMAECRSTTPQKIESVMQKAFDKRLKKSHDDKKEK